MSWRGIHLSETANLSRRHRSIVVDRKGKDTVRIPLEDIGWIIVDSPEAQLSSALLSSCAENGIAVIFTDDRHMPCGSLLPFNTNYAQSEVGHLQISAPGSLQRRLWRRVIRSKISNQSALLQKVGATNWLAIRNMIKDVKPGDPQNVEARAARRYWRSLFNDSFHRDFDGDDRINALLNYGYAVTRAAIARSLAVAGLMPSLGIHHRSRLNSFNLADDIIEPFRPVVDHAVYDMREPSGWDEPYDSRKGLSIDDRQKISAVLTHDVKFADERMNVMNGIEQCISSLVRSLRSRKPSEFVAPELI